MGIPSFFRWLAERYPLICESQDITTSDKGDAFRLLNSVEHFKDRFNSHNFGYSPPDGFDNLYLDVNGIVHNCSHSVVDLCQNITCEDDIFVSIFQCIINIVNIVRPRKLLYLAVDGVAPRAKIIQQRERRFRSAAESTQQQLILDSLKDTEAEEGQSQVKPKEDEEFKFDPIQITPGTAFMERLTYRLQFFALKMINENELWRNLKIVVSGSEVPGEGEHKIMEYIRNDKAKRHTEFSEGSQDKNKPPKQNPYISHCVYGLDADLIILSLATHEPYICLLREQVVFGHMKNSSKLRMMVNMNNYILLHIGILREYLLIDLVEDSRLRSDPKIMDRVVDDFVFLTMFVGNDFLPHMLLANIPEGGLNNLLQIYREYLDDSFKMNPSIAGQANYNNHLSRNTKDVWLTSNCGEVNYDNLITFLTKWAKYENRTIQNFLTNEVVSKTNLKNQNTNSNKVVSFNSNRVVVNHSLTNETNASKTKKSITVIDVKNFKIETDLSDFNSKFPKEPTTLLDYKNRYYMAKLGISNQVIKVEPGSVNSVEDVAREYLIGIQWILFYYYRGVPSWSWHLPCKYPPFIHDLLLFLKYAKERFLAGARFSHSPSLLLTQVLRIEFEKSKPITPYEQLMLVLPPQAAHFLPTVFSNLITDQESPLHQYYPLHFDVDMDNTNVSWGGVTLIPLVPYSVLLTQMNQALNPNRTNNDSFTSRNSRQNLNSPNNVSPRTPKAISRYNRDGKTGEKVDGKTVKESRLAGRDNESGYSENELNYLCSNMLTEEEKDRNKFGLARIYSYDANTEKNVKSPFKIFEDIPQCKVVCNPFFNPTLKKQHFPNTLLLPGTVQGSAAIMHNMWFPSLSTLPYKVVTKRGVDVFNYKSRHPSVYINIFQNLNNFYLTNLTKCTTATYLSVGYPYKHFGKLKSIHTPYFKYVDNKLVPSDPTALKETLGKLDAALDKLGVIVGYKTVARNFNPRILDQNTQVLMKMFQTIQGGRSTPTMKVVNETRMLGLENLCENVVVTYNLLDKNLRETNVTKEVPLPFVTFVDKTTTISKVLVTPQDDYNDLLTKEMLSLQQELRTHEMLYGKYDKPKIKAVCLMEGSMYGRVGMIDTVGQTFDTVTAIFTLPNIKLTIGETALLDFKNFMALQEKLANHKIKWYTFEKTCNLANLNHDVARVMFQKLVVGEARSDLGMNLVFYDRDLQIPLCLPGYTQLAPTYLNELDPTSMVQYSADCVELVKEYNQKFPELFTFLETYELTQEKKGLDANELYPNLSQEQANFKVKQISKYCDSQPFRRLKLTQGNYTCMTKHQIELLVDHQNELNKKETISRTKVGGQLGSQAGTHTGTSTRPLDVKMVRVHHMKNLHIPAYNTTSIKFDMNNVYLGQAVVYVSHSEKVPIGTRGIIVGIYPNYMPTKEGNSGTQLDEGKKEINQQKSDDRDNSNMTLEVVLEKDVLSATDLFGRCKKMRGIFVGLTDVVFLYQQDLLNVDVYSSMYSQYDRNNSNFISYV